MLDGGDNLEPFGNRLTLFPFRLAVPQTGSTRQVACAHHLWMPSSSRPRTVMADKSTILVAVSTVAFLLSFQNLMGCLMLCLKQYPFPVRNGFPPSGLLSPEIASLTQLV